MSEKNEWRELEAEATKLEKAIAAFLASIDRPIASGPYSEFYDAMESALGSCGDARAIVQRATTKEETK